MLFSIGIRTTFKKNYPKTKKHIIFFNNFGVGNFK